MCTIIIIIVYMYLIGNGMLIRRVYGLSGLPSTGVHLANGLAIAWKLMVDDNGNSI